MNQSLSVDDPDDPALILRINEGDNKAFEILYHRHRDWVFRMACRLTGAPHLADDVQQEVFCYFLGKFPGFVLRCELRTFFYPVVRNLSLNAVKKARRYDGGPEATTHLDNLPAPQHASSVDGGIREIITNLSTDHREILLLRFVDGMTLPEISALTGIPLGTAKSRLHHALAALRADPQIKSLGNPVNVSPIDRT